MSDPLLLRGSKLDFLIFEEASQIVFTKLEHKENAWLKLSHRLSFASADFLEL